MSYNKSDSCGDVFERRSTGLYDNPFSNGVSLPVLIMIYVGDYAPSRVRQNIMDDAPCTVNSASYN